MVIKWFSPGELASMRVSPRPLFFSPYCHSVLLLFLLLLLILLVLLNRPLVFNNFHVSWYWYRERPFCQVLRVRSRDQSDDVLVFVLAHRVLCDYF